MRMLFSAPQDLTTRNVKFKYARHPQLDAFHPEYPAEWLVSPLTCLGFITGSVGSNPNYIRVLH